MKSGTTQLTLQRPDQVQIIHLGYSLNKALRELAKIRDYYAQFPSVRRCAIFFGDPQHDNDLDSLFSNLVRFVKTRMRYIPDPHGFETVIAPDWLLFDIVQRGVAYGDCDDHTLLLNTLLASVGFETSFVAVKMGPDSEFFDHVLSGVKVEGQWRDIDTCAKTVAQPAYLKRYVVQYP
jgi:hypothetical protein